VASVSKILDPKIDDYTHHGPWGALKCNGLFSTVWTPTRLVRASQRCADDGDVSYLLLTMLPIARSSVIRETKVTIVQPFDVDIIERTRASMPENSDVPTTASEFQGDLGVVAPEETSVIAQSSLLTV
jgi:hypothetical protein